MTQARFTPGPWTELDGTIWTALHDPVETTYDIGTPIADIRRLKSFAGPAYSDEQISANARLIAAAPELLDALADLLAGWRYIRSEHGDLYGVGWDRAQAKAEAAIRKAEGAQ